MPEDARVTQWNNYSMRCFGFNATAVATLCQEMIGGYSRETFQDYANVAQYSDYAKTMPEDARS